MLNVPSFEGSVPVEKPLFNIEITGTQLKELMKDGLLKQEIVNQIVNEQDELKDLKIKYISIQLERSYCDCLGNSYFKEEDGKGGIVFNEMTFLDKCFVSSFETYYELVNKYGVELTRKALLDFFKNKYKNYRYELKHTESDDDNE